MLIVVMWPNQFAFPLIFCQFLVIFIGLRLHLADSNFGSREFCEAWMGFDFLPTGRWWNKGNFFPDIGKKPNQHLFFLYQ